MSTPNDTNRPGFTPAATTPGTPGRQRDVTVAALATVKWGLLAFVTIIVGIAAIASTGSVWGWASLALALYAVYRIVRVWL